MRINLRQYLILTIRNRLDRKKNERLFGREGLKNEEVGDARQKEINFNVRGSY